MPPKRSAKYLVKHSKALPLEILDTSALIPSNPLSWLVVAGYCAYELVFRTRSRSIEVEYDGFALTVKGLSEMRYLWDYGFFGKGVYSRSEPTWLSRTTRRVLQTDDVPITNEEIVKYRRTLREEYKAERKKLDELERQCKLENKVDQVADIQRQRHELNQKRSLVNRTLPPRNQDAGELRPEDKELVLETGEIKHLEYLELMPVEALFLAITNCVRIKSTKGEYFSDVTLFKTLAAQHGDISPENPFLLQFLVYYHYRTLGWCVKSGLKFASDYVLYERGPPFQHSEFAISIVTESNAREWCHYGAVNRVVGAVKKTMVLAFVTVPSVSVFDAAWRALESQDSLFDLLRLYALDEVVYKRWSASRSRQ